MLFDYVEGALSSVAECSQCRQRLFDIRLCAGEPTHSGRCIEADSGKWLADFMENGGRHRVHRHEPLVTFPLPRCRR